MSRRPSGGGGSGGLLSTRIWRLIELAAIAVMMAVLLASAVALLFAGVAYLLHQLVND